MNTILKKILRGKKACAPKSELWMEKFNGSMMKGSTEVSRGKYGIVYRGCIDNKCKKYIAYKETRDPSAKMEYTIAKKTRRILEFLKCICIKSVMVSLFSTLNT